MPLILQKNFASFLEVFFSSVYLILKTVCQLLRTYTQKLRSDTFTISYSKAWKDSLVQCRLPLKPISKK